MRSGHGAALIITTTMPPLEEPSDAELVAACLQDEPGAWARLVQRFQRLVFTVPRRAGLSQEDAADVFQSTFSHLVEHLPRLSQPQRVRAWLVTTARHETLRLIGRRQRLARHETAADASDASDEAGSAIDQVPDPSMLPDELLIQLEDQDRLRRAVERLDDASRQFVLLYFLQEPPLPYAELARRLGMAEGSIGPTRARCLDKLRRLWPTL